MPRTRKPAPPERARDPDLDRPIRDLVADVTTDPDGWLSTPNPQFSMQPPASLIGTGREDELRNLLRAVKQGAFS